MYSGGRLKYIRLYRDSVNLALVAMRLGRARVVGRSYAAGAPPLMHVCTVGACRKKNRRRPPAALLGAGVLRHAWGNGAHGPNGRNGAKSKPPCGLQIVQQISNSRGLGCSRKAVAHHHQPVGHAPPNPTTLCSAQQRNLLNPHVVQRLL
jgi:hypothetical protein